MIIELSHWNNSELFKPIYGSVSPQIDQTVRTYKYLFFFKKKKECDVLNFKLKMNTSKFVRTTRNEGTEQKI